MEENKHKFKGKTIAVDYKSLTDYVEKNTVSLNEQINKDNVIMTALANYYDNNNLTKELKKEIVKIINEIMRKQKGKPKTL
jgi:hypothetical protein